MNNKRLGMGFEREFVEELRKNGYWVHFISADSRGAQPFDIIAVSAGIAYAFDCKTSATKTFPLSRLEDNQIMAFDKWIACGNVDPCIAVKYGGEIYLLSYNALKAKKRLPLKEGYGVSRWERYNGSESELRDS